MPTKEIDVLGLLTKVEDLLRQPEHWCKGFYKTPDGAYCLVGAVREVTPLMSERWEVSKVLSRAITAHTWDKNPGPEGSGLLSFNDEPSTTHQDISLVLTKAKGYITGDYSE